MRMYVFARRNTLEIVRDPLNLAFGLGFPLVLLGLLSAIQAGIPVDMFMIDRLAPGIAVFGLSFLTLFSATLISRDRSSAFMRRLYTTPMKAGDFIFGYTIPLLPLALCQTGLCLVAAIPFGLKWNINTVFTVFAVIPTALLYIGIGLLCGSIFSDKQVGGICGALLTNVSAWFSGIWFDPALVGGFFAKLSHILPFSHAVELERAVFAGNFEAATEHLIWVSAYAAVTFICAVLVFLRRMKRS